ncbi:MAG: 3-hydroxyacyl-ACP dehydratase FabZ family protein [Anaerovoracaceae bacterium]|nr:beta-hydroxyacyl-ACP dehydratase [Bacillota bacterium]MDY3955038.1 3-hydroxyacyl-ACP dehydratase FabZ family protein [Anaerovoracaceae bacterium]
MQRDEIEKILPHRDGMLLIDEVEVSEGIAHAKKTIRPEEWFLQGHFPGDPIVPGVILCEIMAQSTCALLGEEAGGNISTYLTGLDKARFRNPVRPGDTLEITASITRSKDNFYFAKGEGRVGGKLCVSAEYSFVIERHSEKCDVF